MRLSLVAVGVMTACFSLETCAQAQQGITYPGAVGGTVARAAGGYGTMTSTVVQPATWVPGSYVGTGPSTVPEQVLLPYSYYAVAPAPARIYVPYGANDQFPFLGRAYGNPGDRWSWYTLGGGSSRYLARYYYPPLR